MAERFVKVDRSTGKKRRKELSGRNRTKVAQYEVLGNDTKGMFVPPGTVESFGSGLSNAASGAQVPVDRPVRDGSPFFECYPALRTGLL